MKQVHENLEDEISDLKALDSYEYTTELNAWLETQNDKLIMI